MQSVWRKDEWGDAWEANVVEIIDGGSGSSSSSVRIKYIPTYYGSSEAVECFPLAEIYTNERCTESFKPPMSSSSSSRNNSNDQQEDITSASSKDTKRIPTDKTDNKDEESWEMPFAQDFDDETMAFPYGTYGYMAPMVRTPLGAIRRMLELLTDPINDPHPHQPRTFIDIGCGDGAVLNAVATHHPDWKCVGVDIARRTLEDAAVAAVEAGVADRTWFSRCDYREVLPLSGHSLYRCPGYDGGVKAELPEKFVSSTITVDARIQPVLQFGNLVVYLCLIPSMVRNKEFRENVILPFLDGGATVVAYCYLPGDDGNGDELPYLWKHDRKFRLKLYCRGSCGI